MYSICPENGILLEHFHLCSACRRGSYEGVTVSDPINTLQSLKHKKSSSRKLIHSCNATFPFNCSVTNTGDSLLRKPHQEAREEIFRFKVEITC